MIGLSEKPASGSRLGEEEQAKNKQAMLTRQDELMFLSPLLEGYALKNKLWRECPDSLLNFISMIGADISFSF